MKQKVAWAGALTILFTAQFRAQSHASTHDGVYSDPQASRGEAAYKTACASCHGASLQGTGAQMPALAGAEFLMLWDGQTVNDLFDRIQTSMPADRPGTLERKLNADIVAYILKFNKFPAGKNDLPSDADALQLIQLDAK